jgi:hypothetical protein
MWTDRVAGVHVGHGLVVGLVVMVDFDGMANIYQHML